MPETPMPGSPKLETPKELLSLIIPAHNEEGNIAAMAQAIANDLVGKANGRKVEAIFIDDGSTDATYTRMRELVSGPSLSPELTVRCVRFSRNFGKESAVYAGMQRARGDVLCIVDADLQQPPALVAQMLDVLDADPDIDCVAAYQDVRTSSPLRNVCSSLFYKALSTSSGMRVVENASDFRLFRRPVAEALLSMGERFRFSKGMFSWVGFNTVPFAYTPSDRLSGTSSWTLRSLARYAITGLLGFSTAPLRLATIVGGISAVVALVYLIYEIVRRLAFGVDVAGYTTVVALLLFFGSIILISLGIIGEYLARVYLETKQRPICVVKEDLVAGGNDPVS